MLGRIPPMLSFTDGIYLENAKETLRWGCTRKQAWRVGKPASRFPGDDTRIQWEETLLGGLSCGLLAYLPDETVLDEASVWLRAREGVYRGDDSVFHYLTFFDHLVQQLGTPSSIRSGAGSFYAPILTWQRDGCALQLVTGERHGDFTILEITKGKTPRYAA